MPLFLVQWSLSFGATSSSFMHYTIKCGCIVKNNIFQYTRWSHIRWTGKSLCSRKKLFCSREIRVPYELFSSCKLAILILCLEMESKQPFEAMKSFFFLNFGKALRNVAFSIWPFTGMFFPWPCKRNSHSCWSVSGLCMLQGICLTYHVCISSICEALNYIVLVLDDFVYLCPSTAKSHGNRTVHQLWWPAFSERQNLVHPFWEVFWSCLPCRHVIEMSCKVYIKIEGDWACLTGVIAVIWKVLIIGLVNHLAFFE